MTRTGLLAITLLLVPALRAVNPQLAAVRSVYILPMAGGMDQYLASRLTARGVVLVLADPQHADAILTDHIGQSLETRLDDLYKPPQKSNSTDMSEAGFTPPPPPVSSFGHGRGSYFLVDRRTRSVLWSAYERPHGQRPDDLNHTAARIAQDLAGDLKKAGKPQK